MEDEKVNFSNNIYSELSHYDLRSEFTKAKTEEFDLQLCISKKIIEVTDDVERYQHALHEKILFMKIELVKHLEKAGITKARDEKDGFF